MASSEGGVPTSLIRQVQISLREEAGIPSSYDPHDPALFDLPYSSFPLSEILEKFDSTPSYLRCKHCRGPLLRGLQSIVCVYCGAQQRKQMPPDPIPFKSTFAYAWLLQSLDLDGSEAVGLATGDSDSTKGQNASKDELVLSDLFDLELKWPAELEEMESVAVNKASFLSKSSLNLAGVDLDNFFTEATKETANVSKEQLIPNKEIKSTESHEFPSQESLNLFESAQSFNVVVRTGLTEGAVDDTFSGWEAEFQSASSGTLCGDSKSRDPFMESPIDLSIPGESVFGPYTDIKFKNSIVDSDVKTELDFFPPASIGKPKKNSSNPSSTSDNWIQDDLWPSGNSKVSNSEKVNTDDGSIDAWQDFASSGNAQDPFSSSWKQTGDRITSSNEQASDMNLVSLGNNVQEMEFGSFMQPDLFPGLSRSDGGSTDVKNIQETSIVNRVEVGGLKTGGDGKSPMNDDDGSSDTAVQTDSANSIAVESLMSQMHDLSFMLDTNLSIPKRSSDGFGSDL
ncbi:hypothetical protein BVC80_819g7 [Macleaya cordata]|uniref:DUF7815 domain-containing protein n=1 Tax=Macleaya cordata TaxID=56857 RepID=A0A200Q6W7_MACCD|nr:hypothetical protein BVC80_819g7 [Macleaya cordata]